MRLVIRPFTVLACLLAGTSLSLHAQLDYDCSPATPYSPPVYDTSYVIVHEGWNMVSVPTHAFDWRKEIQFPSATSRAFAYVKGYVATDTLEYGRGYWMKFAAPETIMMIGCVFKPIKPQVVPRWNIIGGSNRNNAVDTITTVPSGIITSAYFEYVPGTGYVETDTVRSGAGYWVKMEAQGVINLPWRSYDGPMPEPPPYYFDDPAWHPFGEWIAVEHAESVDTDGDEVLDYRFDGIWLVNANDARRQPLIENGWSPAWKWDGSELAMVLGGQIYKVVVTSLDPARYDTSSLTQLTTVGANFFPAWSPDGQWIAYDSNVDSPNGMYFIWKMRADGSGKTRLAYVPTVGEVRMPTWSPDGRKIVHQRAVETSTEIVLMDSNGTNVTRLTYDGNDDRYPVFTPDGNKIAFLSHANAGGIGLYLDHELRW